MSKIQPIKDIVGTITEADLRITILQNQIIVLKVSFGKNRITIAITELPIAKELRHQLYGDGPVTDEDVKTAIGRRLKFDIEPCTVQLEGGQDIQSLRTVNMRLID